MDTGDSLAYDSYLGGMNPGSSYSGQPNIKPTDRADMALPKVGASVRHAKSGESGTVVGHVRHGYSAERLPVVKWNGQPGGPGDAPPSQGYSLDSLTNPT